MRGARGGVREQMILGSNGGPASPVCDGWLSYGVPVVAGLMYRDSVEINELKYPMLVRALWVEKVRRRGAQSRRPGSRSNTGRASSR